MELTYKQFEVLRIIEKNKKDITKQEMSDVLNWPLEDIDKIQKELKDNELITSTNQITNLGLHALGPYRVKRAVFLAAGSGNRLLPITQDTPKPMILVNGKSMIETLLDAVVDAGIEEIIIVIGYLGEQFKKLLDKYPNIKFVESDKFNQENNISSAYLVKDKLENSYVLESDLILYNKDIIKKYEYHSNFLGKYVEKTNDWCFETKDGIITKQNTQGNNCYHMYGISYYNSEDGKKLSRDIEKVYNENGGKQKYWEQVPMDICKNNYKIHIRECKQEDIIEIDTFNELKEIDKTYLNIDI